MWSSAHDALDVFGRCPLEAHARLHTLFRRPCELSALLPERTMRAIQETVSPEDEDDEAEPWAASVTLGGPSYEEVVGESDDDEEEDEDDDEEDDDAEPHFPLVIGAVLRFPENRKFPADFELEVDDLMRSILEGRAMDAAEKRIDNLLGGI